MPRYPNQKQVKIVKAPIESGSPYTRFDLRVLHDAMTHLDAGAFKLYVYLAGNAADFSLSLSRTYIEKECGIKKHQYYNAIQTLIDEGYLVQQDTETSWIFYEDPHGIVSPEKAKMSPKGTKVSPKGTNNEEKLVPKRDTFVPKRDKNVPKRELFVPKGVEKYNKYNIYNKYNNEDVSLFGKRNDDKIEDVTEVESAERFKIFDGNSYFWLTDAEADNYKKIICGYPLENGKYIKRREWRAIW